MKKLFLIFCPLLFFCPGLAQENDYGEWVMADSMFLRTHCASTILGSAKVLVTGGGPICELYDYQIDEWVLTDSMIDDRIGHNLITLQDGRALAIGGKYGEKINEIFDEITEEWMPCASFNIKPRDSGTATLLQDGRVLYAGGMAAERITSSCELYDPVAETWTVVDSMSSERINHSAVLLQDGRVLISGGESYSGYLNACEIFDPEIAKWTIVDSMEKVRYKHISLLLPDGRVFVMGSDNIYSNPVNSSNGEVFDAKVNEWKMFVDNLPLGVNKDKGGAILINNNRILLIGKGVWGIYDTNTYTSLYVSPKNMAQRNPMIELLPDGRCILMGGEVFDPGIPGTYYTNVCEYWKPATTGVDDRFNYNKEEFKLGQNYPNPFNPSTKIAYNVKFPARVLINVYNIMGQKVRTLVNGEQRTGAHETLFDATGLPSGIYYYQLKTADFIETKKMVKLE